MSQTSRIKNNFFLTMPVVAKIRFKPTLKHIGLLWSVWDKAVGVGIEYICVELLRLQKGRASRQLITLIQQSIAPHETLEDYFASPLGEIDGGTFVRARIIFLTDLIGAVSGKYMSELALSGTKINKISIETLP